MDAAPEITDGVCNIRRFGARGDATTMDTASIQKALDACAAAGGGTVLVPPGVYLTGTLWLRSHVNLHLQNGATLLASPNPEDYNADDAFPENRFSTPNAPAAPISSSPIGLKTPVSPGHGTIDGHSSAFFGPLAEGATATYQYKNGNYAIPGWRPVRWSFSAKAGISP